MLKSTKQHERYWRERKIDWKTSYLDTALHPHRDLIMEKIKQFRMLSILEIGCASGPNFWRIQKECPWMQFGGVDISKDAIETAKKFFPNCALLAQSPADELFMSDKSSDIVLTDAVLIYIDPFSINKVMNEIKRVARNAVIFCEFHSPSFIERNTLRLKSGYHSYNYKKLLETHNFYDITIEKIPASVWPGTPWEQYGHIITARL